MGELVLIELEISLQYNTVVVPVVDKFNFELEKSGRG